MRPSAGTMLAALALFGCSVDSSLETTGVIREPIEGGELDREHNEVVELITEFGGNAVGLCTGTLIAPNLVLTARHCVAPGGSENVVCGSSPFAAPVAGSDIHVTTAIAPTQSSLFYGGRNVSVPSDGNDTCGFDLALVTLRDEIPANVARPAIPRIDRRATSGEPYVALGYGTDESGNRTAGRMRLEGLVVQCSPGRCGSYVTDTEFVGQEGVCSGDSGGPALDPEGRVIGVLSRGSDPCATPVYGGVAGFRDWIMATAVAAAETGGYEPPFWALSGSSERPPGVAGDPCGSGGECSEGLACYFESDPSLAICTPTCESSRDCEAPAACELGFDVAGGGLCLSPPETHPGDQERVHGSSSGSCAINHRRSPAMTPPAITLLILGVAVAGRLRRRIT